MIYQIIDGFPVRVTIAQVRAEHPSLSISDDPHDEELASYATLDPPLVLIRPQPTAPPPWDPATQSLVEGAPELADGQWVQVWQVVDLPPRPPTPDFAELRLGIQTENGYRAAFTQALGADLMGGLPAPARLDDWERFGEWQPFLESLMIMLRAIPPQDAAHVAWEFLALAQRTHMDPAFLEALQAQLPDVE
jgi:hypothetical protein